MFVTLHDRSRGLLWYFAVVCGRHANPRVLGWHIIRQLPKATAVVIAVSMYRNEAKGATPSNGDFHNKGGCGEHLTRASKRRQHSRVFELHRLEGLVLLRTSRQRQRSAEGGSRVPGQGRTEGARAGESNPGDHADHSHSHSRSVRARHRSRRLPRDDKIFACRESSARGTPLPCAKLSLLLRPCATVPSRDTTNVPLCTSPSTERARRLTTDLG